jgi:hypothetical protein
MWGEVLGWALFAAVNPVLFGFILIVISRPRPVQNLAAYWVGCLIVNLPSFIVPLVLLHLNPSFTTLAQELSRPTTAAGSSFRPIPLVTGLCCLAIAAAMTWRLFSRRASPPVEGSSAQAAGRHRTAHARAHSATPTANSSSLALDTTPPPNSGPLVRARQTAIRGGSATRRLLARAQNSWESGSLWVSFVAGLGCLPPPPLVLIVGLAIMASGAAIGTQVTAAIVYVVTMLAVVEIILVSCLVAPEKTQKILGPVHNWLQTYRLQVLTTMFAIVGVWQVAAGLGIA